MQSNDYVPGVSGWKFNTITGEFEVHSSTATTIAEPQPITVTAGEWSEFDLPANAIERYAFIGAELQKIPDECRESAEISTWDHSFYPGDSSDVRTTLTYVRQETPEEVQDRIEKGSLSVQMTGLAGAGFSIFHDGQLRVRFGSVESPSPFIVADGKVYFREALMNDASIKKAKIASEWSIRVEVTPDGQRYAAGFGIGVHTPSEYKPDIIVKASHMEILPDGLVKITQAPK